MKCHYCGKEVWLVRHLLDGDFCSPAHRKKYHERLRRALDRLPVEEGPPPSIAEFLFAISARDSYLHGGRRSFGFQSGLPWPFLPHTTPDLAPLCTHSFFGPNVALAPAVVQASSATAAEPLATCGPRLTSGGAQWAVAPRAVIEFGQPMAVVADCAGVPSQALNTMPIAVKLQARPMHRPKLALRTVLEEGLLGKTTPAKTSGVVQLRSFIPSILQAAAAPGRPKGLVEALASGRPAMNGTPRLRLTPCVLPVPATPLLAEGTVAVGRAVADAVAAPFEARLRLQSPDLPACLRPSPAVETDAIWNVSAATPWAGSQASADAITARQWAAVLPQMALEPLRPGLMAESRTTQIEAPSAPMATNAAAETRAEALASAKRPTRAPAMPIAAAAAALPEAQSPRVSGSEMVAPQEAAVMPRTAMPVASQTTPRAGELAQSLDLCIEACAGTASQSGLRSAEPLTDEMPAFVPQAAVARSRGAIQSNTYQLPSLAAAAEERSGFRRREFTQMAPAPATIESRRLAPAPAAIRDEKLAMAPSSLSIIGIEPLAEAGPIPLDVYVQRVRVASHRETASQKLPVRKMAVPSQMPALWPSRFEQQVLQDWRRRYPVKQVANPPAPVATKNKVVPMTRRLSVLARVRQAAVPFGKGLAAAAMVAGVMWVSWTFRGVQTTVSADRQWLRTAISARAVRVLDDNFHSGMNLWEGRKNWARSWAYSPDGFMRTGQLALYKPSLDMKDYRLEFFGQIESKSVDWVVRAKDEQNYYAMKLAVTEPGPRPLVSVVRYPVMNGKRGKRIQIPLPIMVHNNTPYHVAVDVKGNHFRAYIENQEVDSWNDDRLRAGGVGFFSENGEHARLYWVRVSNNTDWLGRLCGALAEGKGRNRASNLWNPPAAGELADLDPASVLDGAKNADKKRAGPLAPFAMLTWGRSL